MGGKWYNPFKIGGQRLIVGSDENGIALIPAKVFEEIVKKGMEFMAAKNDESDEY